MMEAIHYDTINCRHAIALKKDLPYYIVSMKWLAAWSRYVNLKYLEDYDQP